MSRPLIALALLLSAAAGPLRAADAEAVKADNPHGPLKDTCATCHGPEGWRPVKIVKSFDHGRFGFPLEGAHVQTACRACHLNLDFKEVGSTCISCHQDNHRGELGDDCGLCHTPRSFIDRARMGRAHQVTRFPLTGAHAGADCDACHALHANRRYVNTPVECVACHRLDYQATRNPNHVASGYALTCQDCHNTVAFVPASAAGNHDAQFFPIFSGTHQGKWSSCTNCHINPSSFADFSCYSSGCHNTTTVTNQHNGVNGFTPTSQACYGCHPRGHS